MVVCGTRAQAGARRARQREDRLATDLAAAVDESLDDLRAEPDPRRAVIAAYARLERVLAAHRLPRRPAEAPLEYLARMLDDLSVSPDAARRLTGLFERAKFSQHAVGTEMKEEAISALETVRDDLLVARALAEQERKAALAAQRARTALDATGAPDRPVSPLPDRSCSQSCSWSSPAVRTSPCTCISSCSPRSASA